MYIYLAETNELHLLHSLVYEPDTTNLIVNKDITIECEKNVKRLNPLKVSIDT